MEKCSEVLLCSDFLFVFLLYHFFYVFYTFVSSCIFCILLFPSVSYVNVLSCQERKSLTDIGHRILSHP